MGTHSVVQPRASYSWSPMAFHTDQAFLKHLRCKIDRCSCLSLEISIIVSIEITRFSCQSQGASADKLQ